MIAHETEMSRHCSKTFPSGKRSGIDDKTREMSSFSNVWIDRLREFHKVTLLKSGLWSNV
jgi:hypothetical protein